MLVGADVLALSQHPSPTVSCLPAWVSSQRLHSDLVEA